MLRQNNTGARGAVRLHADDWANLCPSQAWGWWAVPVGFRANGARPRLAQSWPPRRASCEPGRSRCRHGLPIARSLRNFRMHPWPVTCAVPHPARSRWHRT